MRGLRDVRQHLSRSMTLTVTVIAAKIFKAAVQNTAAFLRAEGGQLLKAITNIDK